MRKAQSAMEYLMTYGWAILIVVVVVAALYALGVFTPGGARVPCSPCFSGGDFTFIDYASGDLLLRTGPREITIDSVTGSPDAIPTISFLPSGILSPGSDITVSGIDTSGDVVITVTYTVTGGLSHTDSATIHN